MYNELSFYFVIGCFLRELMSFLGECHHKQIVHKSFFYLSDQIGKLV